MSAAAPEPWDAETLTAQVRALLPECLERLREFIQSDDPDIALQAAALVLAYAIGPPPQRHVIQTAADEQLPGLAADSPLPRWRS